MDAPRYTHGHHAAVLRSHGWRTAENSAGYLLPHLRPGLSVLDVGSGPGTITVDLADRVRPGRVLGIDAAPAAVEAARAALSSRATSALSSRATSAVDRAPDVRFEVGDAYAISAPDGSFDVVHAHQVLQHLADPVAALAEWRRVCHPDGLVAARDADYAAMCWHPAVPGLAEWLDLYRRVARANGGEPDAGRHLLGWALAAGFTAVESSASAWCFATPADRAWWGGTWAERVRASAFADQAVEQGAATRGDLERIAAAWEHWVAQPDGWFAVLHGEVIARP